MVRLAPASIRSLWDTLDRTPRPTGQGSRPAADASAFFDRLVSVAARSSAVTDGFASMSGLAYFLLYLAGLRHLGFGPSGYEVSVVSNPLVRAFRQVGPFQSEPIARWCRPGRTLFAPLTMLLGQFGSLVGLNLAVSIVAWRGPSAAVIARVQGLCRTTRTAFRVCLLWPHYPARCRYSGKRWLLSLFQWLLPLTVVDYSEPCSGSGVESRRRTGSVDSTYYWGENSSNRLPAQIVGGPFFPRFEGHI